jgi:hypothetical protein
MSYSYFVLSSSHEHFLIWMIRKVNNVQVFIMTSVLETFSHREGTQISLWLYTLWVKKQLQSLALWAVSSTLLAEGNFLVKICIPTHPLLSLFKYEVFLRKLHASIHLLVSHSFRKSLLLFMINLLEVAVWPRESPGYHSVFFFITSNF